jgi:hypothetical protein
METVSEVRTQAPRFTIGDLPARGARLWPGQAALVWDGGTSSRSYAGLDDRVRRLVTLLQEAGVTPGTRVGILARNRPEYFELFFTCARLGAAMVPVNIRLSPREISYQVRDSGMAHAIIDPALRDLADAAGLSGLPHRVLGEDYESALRAAARAPDKRSRDDSLDVVQMYTSGTTGFAKGCTQTSRGWLQSALNFSQGLRLPPAATVLSPTPYFHAFGFGLALAHLVVGGTVAVLGDSGAADHHRGRRQPPVHRGPRLAPVSERHGEKPASPPTATTTPGKIPGSGPAMAGRACLPAETSNGSVVAGWRGSLTAGFAYPEACLPLGLLTVGFAYRGVCLPLGSLGSLTAGLPSGGARLSASDRRCRALARHDISRNFMKPACGPLGAAKDSGCLYTR